MCIYNIIYTVYIVIFLCLEKKITILFFFYKIYVQPATVGNIYPSSGSEKGGTNVTLSGDGFIQLGQLSCIFDNVYSVSAEWIAPSAITCLTPAHQPGVVSVEVSDNGQQTCLGSTNFTYQTRAAVTRIFPTKGSIFGGTILNIYGTGFVNSSGLTCKFGKMVVRGVYFNSTYMQ